MASTLLPHDHATHTTAAAGNTPRGRFRFTPAGVVRLSAASSDAALNDIPKTEVSAMVKKYVYLLSVVVLLLAGLVQPLAAQSDDPFVRRNGAELQLLHQSDDPAVVQGLDRPPVEPHQHLHRHPVQG
jgi:hypothetical protein